MRDQAATDRVEQGLKRINEMYEEQKRTEFFQKYKYEILKELVYYRNDVCPACEGRGRIWPRWGESGPYKCPRCEENLGHYFKSRANDPFYDYILVHQLWLFTEFGL